MESISIATRDGGSVELSGETLQQFAGGLGGALVTRSSPDYEEVRAVWNAKTIRFDFVPHREGKPGPRFKHWWEQRTGRVRYECAVADFAKVPVWGS